MALYVDTKACAADAQIRKDGNLQYHLGVLMMVTGINKLDDKTLPEFMARLEFYQRLSAYMQEDELLAFMQAARDSLGVATNVTYEKQAAWLKRMSTDRFRDIVYAQKTKAEAAAQVAQVQA